MRLLVFSQYFWPETFIVNDLVRTLRDRGHQVVVATGKPNYPEGYIYPGYKAWGLKKEMYDGDIEVNRVPLRPRKKGGAKNLFLNYLSFVVSGWLFFPFLLRGHAFDAIVVFAGSPNVALPALPLRWIKRAHLAIWVQDLWPQSLSATGFIRNPLLLRVVGWVVRFTYACADTVLVQSKGFIAPVAKYTRRDKIVYHPNSITVSAPPPDGVSNLPAELAHLLKHHFCVVFAGNLGTAQSLPTIIGAALRLRDLPQVKIVLIGSGSQSEWLAQEVAKLGLTNVALPGRYPEKLMPEVFKLSSALLITLKNDEIFSYTIPTKMLAYLAAGRPIIASVSGEIPQMIDEAKVGFATPAEDAAGLAESIRKMFNLSEQERSAMAAAGKKYFIEELEIGRQCDRLVEALQKRGAKNTGN